MPNTDVVTCKFYRILLTQADCGRLRILDGRLSRSEEECEKFHLS